MKNQQSNQLLNIEQLDQIAGGNFATNACFQIRDNPIKFIKERPVLVGLTALGTLVAAAGIVAASVFSNKQSNIKANQEENIVYTKFNYIAYAGATPNPITEALPGFKLSEPTLAGRKAAWQLTEQQINKTTPTKEELVADVLARRQHKTP